MLNHLDRFVVSITGKLSTGEAPSGYLFGKPTRGYNGDKKDLFIKRILAAKNKSNVTFDDIAHTLGVTNSYAAQLFTNQVSGFYELSFQHLYVPSFIIVRVSYNSFKSNYEWNL